MSEPRVVTHFASVTGSKVVHVAGWLPRRPYHFLGCNGRAVLGGGIPQGDEVTCRSCLRALADGKVVWALTPGEAP